MPRFSLKDLFLSVTLIAAGIGGMVALFQLERLPFGLENLGWITGLNAFIWFPAMIGAGLGAPFHRKLAGAIIVVVLAWALLYVIVMYDIR